MTSHPIQYQVPWFRALGDNGDIDLEVLYCHRATSKDQSNAGFGVEFEWDTPLFEGYRYRFLHNVAKPPSLGRFSGLNTPELHDLIAPGRFDAALVNGWHYKSAWQAIYTCWSRRIPVMVRGDSNLYSPRSFLRRAIKWPFYRWFIPRCDACLAAGQWSREYFEYYGAPHDRVFCVPHVVDESRFDHEYSRFQKQRRSLRKKWALEQDAAVFVFAGKFIQKKRPMDFVRAIHEAAQGGARVNGLMIGDGPLRLTCEDFVRQSGAPVRFAGFLNQSQIVQGYIASDVLVLPSDGGETWGLVVNEAMSCHRPCIVSDRVGCGPDLVTPGESGFVFPLGDVPALAKIIARCSADPAQLVRMGEVASAKASRYSVSTAVEGVLAALHKVMNRGSGRMQSCLSPL